jgi:hypothetical protein
LTFFGLAPDHRAILFAQIHDIVFYGNGGYDWHTVYDMPIWLRRLTFNMIKQAVEQKPTDEDNIQKSIGNMKKVNSASKPVKVPDYFAKMPKK